MSKRITACLTVAGVIFTVSAIALPLLPDARHEIQNTLRRSDNCLHRKDSAGYLAGLTQDFQGEDSKGDRYNKNQAKQNLLKSFSYAQSITAQTTLNSITFAQGNAIIISHEHTELTILGKRTHRLHFLVFDGLWQSTLVNTKTGWQKKREKQLSFTITEDGRLKSVTNNQ